MAKVEIEEEEEMFPEAEEVLGERLERFGIQMQERKEHLTASMKSAEAGRIARS